MLAEHRQGSRNRDRVSFAHAIPRAETVFARAAVGNSRSKPLCAMRAAASPPASCSDLAAPDPCGALKRISRLPRASPDVRSELMAKEKEYQLFEEAPAR